MVYGTLHVRLHAAYPTGCLVVLGVVSTAEAKDRNVEEIPFGMGVLAAQIGVPKSTVREWVDKHGMIRPMGQSQSTKPYPLYNSASVVVGKAIKDLREKGFELSRIKKLLAEKSLDELKKEIDTT